MKLRINSTGLSLWLSARDTYDWAHKPGASWHCSQLSDKRLFVQFDSKGLCDLTINGRSGDCDASELNAMVSDYLLRQLPVEHPCYYVAVGQFQAA